jgi:hypothetical protein
MGPHLLAALSPSAAERVVGKCPDVHGRRTVTRPMLHDGRGNIRRNVTPPLTALEVLCADECLPRYDGNFSAGVQ